MSYRTWLFSSSFIILPDEFSCLLHAAHAPEHCLELFAFNLFEGKAVVPGFTLTTSVPGAAADSSAITRIAKELSKTIPNVMSLTGGMGATLAGEMRERITNTPTACMLYQNYVARQLHPQRYAVPYIGQKSIEAQIRIKEAELAQRQGDLVNLKELVARYERLNRIPDLRNDDRERITRYIAERAGIAGVQSELDEVIADLGRLDLSKVYDLDQKIAGLNQQKDKCTKDWRITVEQISDKKKELNHLATERIPALEGELKDRRHRIEEKYPADWREEAGEPRFQAELSRLGQAEKVLANFSSQLARTESQRTEKWDTLLRLRSDFNRDFRGSLDVTAAVNEAWLAELERLSATSLPAYEDKIKGAKEKAQRELPGRVCRAGQAQVFAQSV